MVDKFSQDWEVVRVFSSSEPKLATKYELDNIYDINDLFDFIEVLDVRDEMQEVQAIEDKAERDRIRQQQENSRRS